MCFLVCFALRAGYYLNAFVPFLLFAFPFGGGAGLRAGLTPGDVGGVGEGRGSSGKGAGGAHSNGGRLRRHPPRAGGEEEGDIAGIVGVRW